MTAARIVDDKNPVGALCLLPAGDWMVEGPEECSWDKAICLQIRCGNSCNCIITRVLKCLIIGRLDASLIFECSHFVNPDPDENMATADR